jgi:F-box and WD-40 domain protein CDC4
MCDLSVEPKITVLEGHEQAVKCLQFKDDILVTGAYDRTLKVWSLSKGQCIRTIVTEAVWCLQFCGTRHLITGHGDNLIRVWDTTSWQCVRMLHGHTATVMCLQCEGNLLCSGSWDDTLKLWNVDSGEPTKTFSGTSIRSYSISLEV